MRLSEKFFFSVQLLENQYPCSPEKYDPLKSNRSTHICDDKKTHKMFHMWMKWFVVEKWNSFFFFV